MKTFLLAALVLLGSATYANTGSDIEAKVQTLKPGAHIGDARKIYGNLQNGHGPYFWIEDTKAGKDIWLWFIPDGKDDPDQTEIDQFEIPFISSGKSDDPDSQSIIWPEALKGKPIAQVYKDIYKNFIGK